MIDCPRCGNYRFVDNGQGDGRLVECPECRGDGMYRSPCHGELVTVREGRLLGKCWGCVNEAQRAMKRWRRAAA